MRKCTLYSAINFRIFDHKLLDIRYNNITISSCSWSTHSYRGSNCYWYFKIKIPEVRIQYLEFQNLDNNSKSQKPIMSISIIIDYLDYLSNSCEYRGQGELTGNLQYWKWIVFLFLKCSKSLRKMNFWTQKLLENLKNFRLRRAISSCSSTFR